MQINPLLNLNDMKGSEYSTHEILIFHLHVFLNFLFFCSGLNSIPGVLRKVFF